MQHKKTITVKHTFFSENHLLYKVNEFTILHQIILLKNMLWDQRHAGFILSREIAITRDILLPASTDQAHKHHGVN